MVFSLFSFFIDLKGYQFFLIPPVSGRPTPQIAISFIIMRRGCSQVRDQQNPL